MGFVVADTLFGIITSIIIIYTVMEQRFPLINKQSSDFTLL